jgi:hypothetical protein
MRYAGGTGVRGNAVNVRNPIADALRRRLSAAGKDASAYANATLAMDTIL